MNFNQSEQSEQNKNTQSSALPQSNITPIGQAVDVDKNDGAKKGSQSLINLPKGGGAIKGIGEKFETNPVTGTFSMSAPLAISPGRNGFTPQLGLSYNSGSGNSPFGLGWGVGVPNITRKTDKGLPQYDDINESDTFILSGAEDLVPVDEAPRTIDNFSIKRYMPRTEGLFVQIEQWRNTTNGDIHWRTISKENLISVYGQDASARIAHPEDARKVFSWYLQESYDTKGNLMRYSYLKENSDNVSPEVYEKHRLANNKAFTNIYPDQVQYGNTAMYDPAAGTYNGDWLFALVFDYGNYSTYSSNGSALTPTSNWDTRQDPFSVYRAGFEMRTYRLCQRVLMFHYFADDLAADATLVKSTNLQYNKDEHMAQLIQVQHQSHDSAETASMPPLTFTYSEAQVSDKLHSIDQDHLNHLPNGLATSGWQWADLYGEGISSLLKTENEAWYYKPNLGDARWTDSTESIAEPTPVFGEVQQIDLKPNAIKAKAASFYLGDVNSDSQPELVVNAPGVNGYYSYKDGEWQNFQAFDNMPNIEMSHPDVKQIDLSGDGLGDLLISRGNYFELYLSAGKEGYKGYRKVDLGHDDDMAPVVLFSDAKNSVYLTDMTGDGLSDIVRITHNSVCYWPNMGYGRFGEKVLMANPPLLDAPDRFNPSRVLLTDVDGTGTTDIIYLDALQVTYSKNQAGNSWSDAFHISAFPTIDNLSQVSVTDLMGNGTSCLVWSSPLQHHQHHLLFVELTSGVKPYLLTQFENNMGRKVSLQYAPSSKFFMQDKLAGKPWITRLPFPVQVLERVEDHEQVSDTKLVSLYAYHHGHYDVHEREFRGFGMVEQWDTEHLIDSYSQESDYHQDPVYTKSWFHNGAYDNREAISTQFVQEYFSVDNDSWELADSVLPSGLTFEEEREACRALRGQLLRSEIYGQDASAVEDIPYLVEEKNMTVKLLQPKGENKHAVFLPINNEAISYHYERDADDPRIAHSVTLNTDEYGNVLEAFNIAYPRRDTNATNEQKSLKVVCTQNSYINRSETNLQIIGVPYESKQLEFTGLVYNDEPFSKESLQAALDFATEINFSASPSSGLEKRCFQHQKSFFYDEALTDSLPLGEIASHALLYKSLNADLTEDLLNSLDAAGDKYTIDRLSNEAAYVFEPGANGKPGVWWIPSEVISFDPLAFYLPKTQSDVFGNSTQMYYDNYKLLLTETIDALGYKSTAEVDYRVLQVKKLTDPNGNSQELAFDTLGMVSAVALVGSRGEGDTLSDPSMKYSYDLNAWLSDQKPAQGHVELRVKHGTGNTGWMESYEYTGGWGNLVMTKVQAEDGDAMQITDGHVETVYTTNRWVGTGRTVYNNKGEVVRQYEPYFSTTHEYEDEEVLVQHGVGPVLHYDALGRNIKTDLPDGTLTKVEFTPWEQYNYDQNDTVLESQWYQENKVTNSGLGDRPDLRDKIKGDRGNIGDNISPDPNNPGGSIDLPDPTDPIDPENPQYPIDTELIESNVRVVLQTEKHANTPQVRYFDNLGREYMVEDDNGDYGKYRVHTKLDIAGRPVEVTDAKGRLMTTNTFAMQQALQVHNIDSGTRTLLNDATGQPLYSWDSRNHKVRMTYDTLRRPLATYLKEGNNAEIKVQEQVYGTSDFLNNIGQLEFQYDQSGRTQMVSYDFKGNPEMTAYTFYAAYQAYKNLNNNPAYMPTTHTNEISVDALNRPVSKILPDGSVETYQYNKAGLLESLTSGGQAYINNINYNEKGQRTDIYYANGSKTKYEYDAKNFRLTRLLTTRNTGADILQDLNYTYDPVGNIVEQVDNAKQTFYYSNTVIEPKGQYEYDALYRLVKATGRELNSLAVPTHSDFANNIGLPNTAANAMQNYTHNYTYDELGNMLNVNAKGDWTRDYFYNTHNNFLQGHTVLVNEYSYDAHGNMLNMPHLQAMHWDYNDWLTQVDLDTSGNKAYYVYNAAGERVRKVVIKDNIHEERFYFGDFEIYHKFVSGSLVTERTTVNISDDKKKIATAETLTIDQGSLTVNPVAVIRYQYDNHLGSASLELDESADIISYEEYHPFGTTSYRSGRSETETSQKRYKYVGKERDEETGLYYYGFRYYAAWICRFVSVDPLQFEYPHYTPFQYAGNKPITYIDLDGLEEAPGLYSNSCDDLQFEREYGLLPDQIWDTAVNGLNNIAAIWIEIFLTDEKEGSVIRKMFEDEGIILSNDIPNEELGDIFKVRFRDREPEIEVTGMGYIEDVTDTFIATVDLAAILYPDKVTGFMAKASPLTLKVLSSGLNKMPSWVLEGIKFENKYFSDLIKSGKNVHRRVSFKALDEDGEWVRAVVDGVIDNGDDTFTFIETKLRNTTELTKNQKIVYKALENGEAIAVGDNALNLFDEIGQKVKADVKRINKYND
ncbi:SpvB/TcaC N-terminal domain-containing protein [Marinifilum sp.]|uniref:SpvB/TcaC N-terminal domain-containing protein n=1 Tax=Marinifilum sp. TaxID=2033137 RepID=UPI003BABE0FB